MSDQKEEKVVEENEFDKADKPRGMLTKDQIERLENNFSYHPPFGDLPQKYEIIRADAKEFAIILCKLAPESRELSLALTKLEEAVMWVNAAIARNEKEV